MSHIPPNYAFLWFWSIFGIIIRWKLLFLVKKVTISERITEILRKFIFLNMFEKAQILRKIWSPQNKPQTAKLFFCFVLKHFRANLL